MAERANVTGPKGCALAIVGLVIGAVIGYVLGDYVTNTEDPYVGSGAIPGHSWAHSSVHSWWCGCPTISLGAGGVPEAHRYGAARESNLPSVRLRRRTGFEGLQSEVRLATGAAFRRRSCTSRSG
jgi:hypothetical protein